MKNTMYKLMKGKTCMMLAPLQCCFDEMKKQRGNATVEQLNKEGWHITPARPSPLSYALLGVAGL